MGPLLSSENVEKLALACDNQYEAALRSVDRSIDLMGKSPMEWGIVVEIVVDVRQGCKVAHCTKSEVESLTF